MKKTRLVWLSFALVASAVSLGACGRAHLSSYYGQSYAAWFGAQHVNKKGANAEDSRKIVQGVLKSYQAFLASQFQGVNTEATSLISQAQGQLEKELESLESEADADRARLRP